MMAIWTTSPHCCWNSTVERKRAGNTTGSCYYVVEGLYPYQPRCSCALQRRASSVSSTKSTMTQSLLSLLTVSFIHWRLSILVIVFPCNRCVMWNNDDNSIDIMIVWRSRMPLTQRIVFHTICLIWSPISQHLLPFLCCSLLSRLCTVCFIQICPLSPSPSFPV